MDKTCLQILAEITQQKDGSYRDGIDLEKRDCIIFSTEAIEAMKIAMKQAFETARKANDDPIFGYQYDDFDEWFNKLEEKK